jgi:hypothetical protein
MPLTALVRNLRKTSAVIGPITSVLHPLQPAQPEEKF